MASELHRALREGSPPALRAVIVGHLRRQAVELGTVPEALTPTDGGDQAWDREAEAVLEATAGRAQRAQEPPEMHNLLLDLAAAQGLNVEGIERMPRWKEVRPLFAVILRVFAGGPGAVGLEEIAEGVGSGLGLPEPLVADMKLSMAADQVDKYRRGEDPHVLSSYLVSAQTLVSAVENASDQHLMRTTAAVLLGAQFQVVALLGSAAALKAAPAMPLNMRPEGVVCMLQHPMWLCWGQSITRATVRREESMAILIAEALDPRRPANTETLAQYLRFLRVELGLPDEDITAFDGASPS